MSLCLCLCITFCDNFAKVNSCVLTFADNNRISLNSDLTIVPCRTANCKTSHIIYAAICKLCQDFYFGKSLNKEHVRMNGHRDKFHADKFNKSALAFHIFKDHHPNHIGNTPHDGLSNYNVVILESVNAINLRRRES